jgi:ABC-type uncharacterized transport system substrate-binding protein
MVANSRRLSAYAAAEDPANIPFQEVVEKKLVLNQEGATRLGMVFPPDVVASANG